MPWRVLSQFQPKLPLWRELAPRVVHQAVEVHSANGAERLFPGRIAVPNAALLCGLASGSVESVEHEPFSGSFSHRQSHSDPRARHFVLQVLEVVGTRDSGKCNLLQKRPTRYFHGVPKVGL